MKFERGNLKEEVWNLYKKIKIDLKDKTLQVLMEKPYFSDGTASYLREKNGNFKIYVTPGHMTDFIFSHELLHVYMKINDFMPNLISFTDNISDTSMHIALSLSDAIEHKWIINEQRRMAIAGEKEYVDNYIDNLNSQSYKEVGKASEDFLLIKYLFTFMDDYPEQIDRYIETISKKYPFSVDCAYELLKEKPKIENISPYQARRFIIRSINKWIELFSKDMIDCGFIRQEIIVKPVFRQGQRGVRAEALIGILGKPGKYYFYTISDSQKCCPDFAANIESISHGKSMLSVKTIGQVFDEMKLPHYIDDRNGTWNRYY